MKKYKVNEKKSSIYLEKIKFALPFFFKVKLKKGERKKKRQLKKEITKNPKNIIIYILFPFSFFFSLHYYF